MGVSDAATQAAGPARGLRRGGRACQHLPLLRARPQHHPLRAARQPVQLQWKNWLFVSLRLFGLFLAFPPFLCLLSPMAGSARQATAIVQAALGMRAATRGRLAWTRAPQAVRFAAMSTCARPNSCSLLLMLPAGTARSVGGRPGASAAATLAGAARVGRSRLAVPPGSIARRMSSRSAGQPPRAGRRGLLGLGWACDSFFLGCRGEIGTRPRLLAAILSWRRLFAIAGDAVQTRSSGASTAKTPTAHPPPPLKNLKSCSI